MEQAFGFKVDKDGYLCVGEDEFPVDKVDKPAVQIVELPSGHSTQLERPSLASLLSLGRSKFELVERVWKHPDVSVRSVELSPDEIDFIYEWALNEFAESEVSIPLGIVCRQARYLPSQYIGIYEIDLNAAFTFDSAIFKKLSEAEAEEQEKEEAKQNLKNKTIEVNKEAT